MANRKLTVIIAGDDKSLRDTFDSSGNAADGFGKKMGLAAVATGAAFVGAGAVAGKALFDLGSSFDSADDKIRVGTGATGDALEGLSDSFRNVFAAVPTDMESASTAIADLNTRLGLTGQPLEELSTQFLNLSRITETDVAANIDNMTRVFGDAGVAIEDQAETLDQMFRASQASGISLDELANSMVQMGAPMRNLGFGIEDSMALLAQFNKNGVNTETVIAGMRAGIGKMAKAGEDVPDTFRRIVTEIENLGPGTESLGLAMELFGQKAGPDMADAITNGQFAVEDMLAAITNGTDTINGAAADTADFGEKWQVIKNKIFVGLEPLAMRIFGGLGNLMDKLGPKIDAVSAAFSEDGLSGVFRLLGDNVSAAWPGMKVKLAELGVNLLKWIGDTAPVVGKKLLEWGAAFVEWIVPQIPPALEALGELLQDVIDWMVSPGLELLVKQLSEWGVALVKWVGPMIPPLLIELSIMMGKVLFYLGVEVPLKLAAELGKWALEFGKWVATASVEMLAKLPGLLADLARWGANSGRLGLYNLGKDLAKAVGDGFKDLVVKVLAELTALPGKLGAKITELLQQFYDLGKKIGNKIADGAKAGIKSIPGALANAIPGVSSVKGWLGFHTGGTFRAPTAGGEGLAMLRDGEHISTPGRGDGGGGTQRIVVQIDGQALIDALVRQDRLNGTTIVRTA